MKGKGTRSGLSALVDISFSLGIPKFSCVCASSMRLLAKLTSEPPNTDCRSLLLNSCVTLIVLFMIYYSLIELGEDSISEQHRPVLKIAYAVTIRGCFSSVSLQTHLE